MGNQVFFSYQIIVDVEPAIASKTALQRFSSYKLASILGKACALSMAIYTLFGPLLYFNLLYIIHPNSACNSPFHDNLVRLRGLKALSIKAGPAPSIISGIVVSEPEPLK